jgi:hypothetical protein
VLSKTIDALLQSRLFRHASRMRVSRNGAGMKAVRMTLTIAVTVMLAIMVCQTVVRAQESSPVIEVAGALGKIGPVLLVIRPVR